MLLRMMMEEEEEEGDDVEEEGQSQDRDPAKTVTQTLCELEQSKCMWTLRKNHFVQKCMRKHIVDQNCDPDFVRACVVTTHLRIAGERFCADIYS